jgi:adenylylsulfate kinase
VFAILDFLRASKTIISISDRAKKGDIVRADDQPNIIWQHGGITQEHRNRLNGHPSQVIWLTGLSGAGKSTLAQLLEQEFHIREIRCFVLDGDNIRHGLNSDLGFNNADRHENIRRLAEVAHLFSEAGMVVIVASISPFQKDRELARSICGKDFLEIFVKCSIEVCKQRDPKGLYQKAGKGLITNFTGISSPYEPPISPEIIIESDKLTKEDMLELVIEYLVKIRNITKLKSICKPEII